MTKTELVDNIAEKTGLTKKDSKQAVDAFLEVITDTLKSEATKDADERDKVQLIGFGSFEVRDRSARTGRNPQTGEELQIPARKVPAFKSGKGLKDAVNGDK
ncbi:HU family DNA-binding protein [Selenihalanaerobacter shriftii]|uniref:DNA-binding protein HU-beta n=1 Tax=Selenihalanaerobacter shriftii TaxID=142842 RepID=A0A1T4LHN6_9FIRM|nr:HU family DNA-binding protein [Selenihalanaerobacter shriftii]SJZ54118.1 DNA-binding protein HU-beta [Selenihalanaerobacter shriftii]